MACFMPFNNRNLDISFLTFRPTVVVVDDLLDALQQFSLCTQTTLGCVQTCSIQSIHGNMIIWYGAWLKKSREDKESLTVTLVSMLKNLNISSMATLVEHTFWDAYAGESRDGSSAAKFYKGDTVFISLAIPTSTGDVDDLSYACLALFKSHFLKMKGVSAGVCLKCKTTSTSTSMSMSKPTVACLYVWKSLHFCYSWVLSTDQGKSMLPYLERLALNIKYDIFRVVYVSAHSQMLLEQGSCV